MVRKVKVTARRRKARLHPKVKEKDLPERAKAKAHQRRARVHLKKVKAQPERERVRPVKAKVLLARENKQLKAPHPRVKVGLKKEMGHHRKVKAALLRQNLVKKLQQHRVPKDPDRMDHRNLNLDKRKQLQH